MQLVPGQRVSVTDDEARAVGTIATLDHGALLLQHDGVFYAGATGSQFEPLSKLIAGSKNEAVAWRLAEAMNARQLFSGPNRVVGIAVVRGTDGSNSLKVAFGDIRSPEQIEIPFAP